MIYAPDNIMFHLRKTIPNFINIFNDEIDIDAEIIDGSPQKLKVTASNDFELGQKVQFTNSLIDNGINDVSLSVGILRFTVNSAHDLTENYSTIELRGFTDDQFNGYFDLKYVMNEYIFEIELDALPVLSGSEVLRENWSNGLNDIFEIKTITSSGFEVEIIGKPEYDILPIPQIKTVTGYRMEVVDDYKRLEEIYTKQPPEKISLFLIMNDVNVSKDRNLTSDAIRQDTEQNDQRILNIGRFTIVVIIPTANKLTSAAAINLCYVEIYEALIKSISGMRFIEDNSTGYFSNLIAHGSTIYNRAYYGHAFDFEQPFDYNWESTYREFGSISRALRRINISFADLQDGSYLEV